jgi:hypothetical protein
MMARIVHERRTRRPEMVRMSRERRTRRPEMARMSLKSRRWRPRIARRSPEWWAPVSRPPGSQKISDRRRVLASASRKSTGDEIFFGKI